MLIKGKVMERAIGTQRMARGAKVAAIMVVALIPITTTITGRAARAISRAWDNS